MPGQLMFDYPTMRPPADASDVWHLAAIWFLYFRGEVYRIPAGFGTDGASIPRCLWWICGTPLKAPRIYAAIVHDYLYGGGDPEATRADADDIYRDLQIALGVSRVKAYVEWIFLRLFGWSHYTPQKKEITMSKSKITSVVCSAAAAILAGCAVTRAEWGGEELVRGADGQPVIVDGKPLKLARPTKLYANRHWFESTINAAKLRVNGSDIEFDLNGYRGGVDTNFVPFVRECFDGVAELTAKVCSAIGTSGGSIAANGGAALISSAVNRFVSKGGNVATAKVTLDGSSCRICDDAGVCVDCEDCVDCPDGACNP